MYEDPQVLPDQTDGERRGLQMAELANAMVRIYKEQFGRGPTKSHSVYATPDVLSSSTPDDRSTLRSCPAGTASTSRGPR